MVGRNLFKSLALIGALIIPNMSVGADISRTVQSQSNWGGYGVKWNRTASNRTEMRYGIFNQNGMIEICGVYSTRGASVTRAGREAMREAILSVNGKRVRRDMRFFNQVSNKAMANKLVGQPANCLVTNVAVPSGDVQYKMDIPVSRIRLN